ncbi:MAG: flagellin FliC [Oligoflexia bacterium]|nr:flagellin FliC [Oligoflexia bacterium]
MGLRINTNVAAIQAHRNLSKSQARAEHALAAIAGGSRFVRAGDDAAGLAISENLRGQIASIRQAKSNSNNAISLIQVAEGGLNEQNNILIRLRELSIQAASDNVSDTEREFLDQEYQLLTAEFNRIAKTTVFGNKKLLDGNGGEFTFHVGAFAGPDNRINYTLNADSTTDTLGIDGLSIKDRDDAQDNLEALDKALVGISAIRANFGAIQSRLQATTSNLETQYENLAASKSRLSDTDLAYETGELVQAQILNEAGIGVLAQANQMPTRAAKLLNVL